MRIAVAATVVCLGVVGLCTADEVKASIKQRTDIPAQRLGSALASLAKDREFQVLYRTETVGELRTQGANGDLTLHEAMRDLLRGTGLSYRFIDDQTVKIFVIGTEGGGAPEQAGMGQPVVPGSNVGSASQTALPADTSASNKSFWSRLRLAQAGTPSASTPSAFGENNGQVEEVVVTAQKRTERLQDVPISISVMSGEDLDGATVRGVAESLNRVPGVVAQESYIGGGTQLTIRGVGASSTILHGSSPIAYYLDSVPFGLIKTSIAPDANAFDMARVEVLRGPQGTLYGASALNGVVRVLTKDADLDEFEFKGRTSMSSTRDGGENYRGDMAVNVPLIEGKLAARAVAGYAKESGWFDRPNDEDANDARLRNYRLKLNAQPTDAWAVELSAWRSRSDFGAPSMGLENRVYSIDVAEPMATDYDAYGFTTTYDFSSVSVAAMTAYLDYNNSGNLNVLPLGLPDVPFFNGYRAHVFTQEVNINSSSAGDWRWSVGGIYRDAKDRTYQTITGVLPAPVNFTDTSESYAVFGEVTRAMFDGRLELTAGLRYFSDDVGTRENTSFTGDPDAPLVDVSSKFSKTTPRVVLSWHPSSQVTGYLSYAEGFRSGFQQQPNVILTNPAIPPVDADSLKNYEVGAKGNMGGVLSFDAAVYYIDWQDVQSDNSIMIGGVPVSALANGQSASGVGVDVALMVKPTDGLELGVNGSWNDLAWDSAVFSGNDQLFAKGERLSLSPEYTLGMTADYVFAVGGGGHEVRLSGSANYTSKQFMRISSGSGQGESILISRASVAYAAADRWSVMLYGDNLNDENGIIQQAPFPVANWAIRPRPRTFGLQLEYFYR